MSVVLLDTTVASFLHPDKHALPLRSLYEPHLKDQTPALSFQSIAELWAWAEHRGWGPNRRKGLDAFIQRFLVIPYDYALARVWARVSVLCERRGRRLEAGDTWIAATAVHRGIPLLTHDEDYVGLDLPGLEVVCYVGKDPKGISTGR